MILDLALRQGVTKVVPVVARDDAGTRLVLTGLTGTAISWRLSADDTAIAVLTYTLSSGIALTNAAQGEFSITIAAADLTESLFGYYQHQCKVLLSGVTYMPILGNAFVAADID